MTAKLDLSYGGIVRLATTVVAVLMVLYHVWAIAFGTPEAVWFRGTHLLFAMLLVFIIHRRSGMPEGLPSALDLVLLALAVAPILYLFVSCKLPADQVYTMTKAIADNTQTLATVAKDIGALTPKGMAEDIGVPFHPGAAKYYKEAGISVQSH